MYFGVGNKPTAGITPGHILIKKAFRITLMVVFLLLMFTGCSAQKASDSDEDHGERESRASKREMEEASEERTDSENGLGTLFGFIDKDSGSSEDVGESVSSDDQSNSPIIGTWRSGDSSRPTYIGMMDSNVEYVFGQDGYYMHIVITSINYIYQCTAYTGSYTVADGEVIITDRYKSTFDIQNYDWGEAYEAAAVAEFAPFEDAVWPLDVIDSENITINGIALYRVN